MRSLYFVAVLVGCGGADSDQSTTTSSGSSAASGGGASVGGSGPGGEAGTGGSADGGTGGQAPTALHCVPTYTDSCGADNPDTPWGFACSTVGHLPPSGCAINIDDPKPGDGYDMFCCAERCLGPAWPADAYCAHSGDMFVCNDKEATKPPEGCTVSTSVGIFAGEHVCCN